MSDKKSSKKNKNLDKNSAKTLKSSPSEKQNANSKKHGANSKKSASKNAKLLNDERLNAANSINSALNSAPNLANPTNSANTKTKKTFWPYGILLALFAIVCACVVTIIYASNYPVYEDDSFLQKYQQVDANFNEIQQKDEAFKRDFRVSLNLKPQLDTKKREFYEVKFGTKELEFVINEINEDKHAQGIKPALLLTRPHTNTQDYWLQTSELALSNAPYVINNRGQTSTRLKKSFNRYTFKATLPELEKGRWQIKLNAQKNESSIGFYEFNLVVVP